MPQYVFRCIACEKTFTALILTSEDTIACDGCGVTTPQDDWGQAFLKQITAHSLYGIEGDNSASTRPGQ